MQLDESPDHSGDSAFQNVIRLMASGTLDIGPMVSAGMKLDDAPSAFKRLANRQEIKIILLPN